MFGGAVTHGLGGGLAAAMVVSYADLNMLVAQIAALQSALASNQIGPDGLAGSRVYAALGRHLSSFFQFAMGREPEAEFSKKEVVGDSELPEVEIWLCLLPCINIIKRGVRF